MDLIHRPIKNKRRLMFIITLTLVLVFARTAIVDGTILEKFQDLDTFVIQQHKGEDAERNRGYFIDNKEGFPGYDPSLKYDPTGKSDGAWWWARSSPSSKDFCWRLRLHHVKGSSTYTLTSYQVDESPKTVEARRSSDVRKSRVLWTFTEEQLNSEYER